MAGAVAARPARGRRARLQVARRGWIPKNKTRRAKWTVRYRIAA